MGSFPTHENASQHDGPRQTIAIVDHNESVRHALVRLCRSDGFHAESYQSAEDFLDANRTEFIDCVILEYRLPGKNGLELLHEILVHYRHMPVVMVAGDADQEFCDRAIENGAIGSLPRPADDGALLEIVRWAIKMGKAE